MGFIHNVFTSFVSHETFPNKVILERSPLRMNAVKMRHKNVDMSNAPESTSECLNSQGFLLFPEWVSLPLLLPLPNGAPNDPDSTSTTKPPSRTAFHDNDVADIYAGNAKILKALGWPKPYIPLKVDDKMTFSELLQRLTIESLLARKYLKSPDGGGYNTKKQYIRRCRHDKCAFKFEAHGDLSNDSGWPIMCVVTADPHTCNTTKKETIEKGAHIDTNVLAKLCKALGCQWKASEIRKSFMKEYLIDPGNSRINAMMRKEKEKSKEKPMSQMRSPVSHDASLLLHEKERRATPLAGINSSTNHRSTDFCREPRNQEGGTLLALPKIDDDDSIETMGTWSVTSTSVLLSSLFSRRLSKLPSRSSSNHCMLPVDEQMPPLGCGDDSIGARIRPPLLSSSSSRPVGPPTRSSSNRSTLSVEMLSLDGDDSMGTWPSSSGLSLSPTRHVDELPSGCIISSVSTDYERLSPLIPLQTIFSVDDDHCESDNDVTDLFRISCS